MVYGKGGCMSTIFGKSDLERLAAIIKAETGNNVQEKNYSMIESRLNARMLKLGLNGIDAYWAYFAKNEAAERTVLKSLMTTHYTFFFRESAHFEQLDSWINQNISMLKQRWLTKKEGLRVWSAACSKGQEVYSLAMFLELNLAQKYGIGFEVVGSDIDQESVDYARNGVYPIKEVNTIPQKYLNGCWRRGTGSIKDFAAVHPNLKAKTKFFTNNLLLLDGVSKTDRFDVIFIRNVFIYFSEDQVKKIALSLKNYLHEGGLFVSGLSEPLRFEGWTLQNIAPSVYVNIDHTKAAAAGIATPRGFVEHALSSAVPIPNYRVLCVDDSPTIQVVMKKIFAQDPLCKEVVTAVNGEDARQKLEASSFDVITLDIHMPVMTGIEFLEKVYKKGVHPPVIMVSSVNRSDADLATKAIDLGAYDYVEKPAMNNLQKSVDELLTKVKDALQSRKQSVTRLQTLSSHGTSEPTPVLGSTTKTTEAADFNRSISQKIVVPDASQCLRWVKVDATSGYLLESILKLQGAEMRSPAIVISCPSADTAAIKELMTQWSPRKIEAIDASKSFLRPNALYLTEDTTESKFLSHLKVKNVSLQLLSVPHGELDMFAHFGNLQVLADESVVDKVSAILQRAKLNLSDTSPATSFVSLSLEFFGNLRKSSAA
jgi:chemotaxis protein methyltransferase CheR